MAEEGKLEVLLAQLSSPLARTVDRDLVQSLCDEIEIQHDGPQCALPFLAHKIQSPHEREALQALSVLEECVHRCGPRFASEFGKFRFLNELIKVVSPKYLAHRSTPKVKQKIVELMFKWSVEMKGETKISEAYQMLKKQGIVSEDPVYVLETKYEPAMPPVPPRPKNEIFEDEEKAQLLKRLLRSRNPEDLQAANRLIKNMVKEADKRMELLARRNTELETVHNNAKVLSDMLLNYRPMETSQEEKDLMKELYESCERLRPKLFRLAAEMEEKDEGLGDILKASDELSLVINEYKRQMGMEHIPPHITDNSSASAAAAGEVSLLDLASPAQEAAPETLNASVLDDQLLALGLNDSTTASPASASNCNSSQAKSTLEDLGQIFSTSSISTVNSVNIPGISGATFPSTFTSADHTTFSSAFTNAQQAKPTSGDFSVFSGSAGISSSPFGSMPTVSSLGSIPSPMQPFMNSGRMSPLSSSSNQSSDLLSKSLPSASSKGLEELDALGQSLLKQSLPASNTHIEFTMPSASEPPKVSLSQLQKQQQQQQSQQEPAQQQQSVPGSPSLSRTNSASDTLSASSPSVGASPSKRPSNYLPHLEDVFVPLESIQLGSIPPITLHQKNGVTVVIHFGKDSPRPGVSVMVVSTVSINASPVKDVSFQPAVPKSMKVKLQPPSAVSLPPFNPILPPSAITQVMLLANPNKEKVRLKYKITYAIEDETHTDTGEVDNLFGPR